MGLPFNTQRQHHGLKHSALGHRAIVEVNQQGSPLEGEGRIGLQSHRIEQESQGAFGVFAIYAAVFHVTEATAVIDHTKQHQGRLTLTGIDPIRPIDVLQVGRRHIELPAVIAVFGFEAHGGRLAGEAG